MIVLYLHSSVFFFSSLLRNGNLLYPNKMNLKKKMNHLSKMNEKKKKTIEYINHYSRSVISKLSKNGRQIACRAELYTYLIFL